MTFILAIQLEDSVVITADNRSATVTAEGKLRYKDDDSSKLYAWNNGIITGSGEHTVIHRAIEFLIKLSKSKIESLPKCLEISRMIRELEVTHIQIKITKLLYSDYTDKGVQLYSIQPDESGAYQVEACQKNEIVLWLFHPEVSAIMPILQHLYGKLKSRQAFAYQQDWFNYYIHDLCQIYKTQAQHDVMMSASFDYFFQSKHDYLHGHIANTQEHYLNF